MGGHRRAGNRAGLCALALLLAVALGFGATGEARAIHAHKHAAGVAAVLAVGSVDTQHAALDLDRSTPPRGTVSAVVSGSTPDSSSFVSSRTARTPQVRGPPGQGCA